MCHQAHLVSSGCAMGPGAGVANREQDPRAARGHPSGDRNRGPGHAGHAGQPRSKEVSVSSDAVTIPTPPGTGDTHSK